MGKIQADQRKTSEGVSFGGRIPCGCRSESGVVYGPARPSMWPSRSGGRTTSVSSNDQAIRARVSVWQRFAVGLAGLLLWTVPLLAALTGDIRGFVLDPQNLPVENAQVTVKNIDTGATRVETTSSVGSFSALQLDVGNYRISVEKQGFRIYSLDNVTVRSGGVASIRVALQVGSVNERVAVESGAESYLDAASAMVITSLNAQTVQNLPSLDRDPVALAQLAAGVVPVSKDNSNFLPSGSFNVNGQRARSNNITVDNAIATDIATNQQAGTGTFSLDSVQEATLITSGFSAEFGRNSGSQLQLITKGGSNEFHGTAYWFLQNSALNAENFFAPKVTPFNQNVWGGNVGGPVVKNRVFLFGEYQGLHSSGAGGTRVAAVLTQAQAGAITDPTSLSLFQAVGAPQSPTGLESNPASNSTKQYSWSLRADETFSGGKDLITERYSTNPVISVTPSLTFLTSTLPNYGAIGVGLNHFLNVRYTHTFTPTVINQARFQFVRSGSAFEPFTTLTPPYAPAISISGYPLMGISGILPQSRVENIMQYSDALSWAIGRHGLKFGVDVFRYQDNSVTDFFSRGVFFYGDLAAFQSGAPSDYLQIFGNPARGYRAIDVSLFAQDDIRVTPTFTVNLGLRLDSSGGVSEAHNTMANLDQSSQASLGGGGSGPLGSIDLGGNAYGRNNNWAPRLGAAWNPRGGKLVFRGDYGWIYDFLFLNPVIDTGLLTTPYSVVFSYSGAAMTGGNSYANFAVGTAAAQAAAQASVGTFPLNEVNFGNISPVEQNLKNPMTAEWNAGLEYQVTKDFVLKATYIGNSSEYLQVSMPINLIPAQNRPAPATSTADELARRSTFQNTSNLETGTGNGSVTNNRLDPRFNSVIQVQSVGKAEYEGLQIQALRVLSHGLSFQASYTYGHSMDDVSDALSVYSNESNVVQNPLNLASNWGHSAFDVRNRFVMNSLFEVPWAKSCSGICGEVLHGWTVDGIIFVQSGLPVSILSGSVLGISDVALIGGGTELANGNGSAFTPAASGSAAAAAIPGPCNRGILGSPPIPGNPTCANVSNFPLTQPLLGNFGSSGRNQMRLDGLCNLDMGVYKNTRLNEKLTVQFRWETYNVFNHSNFSGFVNTLTAPNFGTYTNTATDIRKMQFALKVLF
jgi:hypothetical protein